MNLITLIEVSVSVLISKLQRGKMRSNFEGCIRTSMEKENSEFKNFARQLDMNKTNPYILQK